MRRSQLLLRSSRRRSLRPCLLFRSLPRDSLLCELARISQEVMGRFYNLFVVGEGGRGANGFEALGSEDSTAHVVMSPRCGGMRRKMRSNSSSAASKSSSVRGSIEAPQNAGRTRCRCERVIRSVTVNVSSGLALVTRRIIHCAPYCAICVPQGSRLSYDQRGGWSV